MANTWRIAGLAVALLMLVFLRAESQNVTKAEYFFDTDPGQGNGFNLPLTAGPNPVFTANISITGLPEGFHFLGVRVKESGGRWSLFDVRGFYISSVAISSTNVSKAEYFIDTDPGQGNGTPVVVPSGATVNSVFTVPTASLQQGFHFLAFRVRDVFGRWSIAEVRGFYISGTVANAPNITAAEYFFDSDPGQGSGTPLTIAGGASVNFTAPISVNALTPGFHFIAVRMKDASGRWGIFESRGFYVTGNVSSAPSISGAEFFFDSDPGLGNGTALTIPAGDVSNANLTVPIGNLSPGFHFLTIRIKDASGKWGQFESRGFYVYAQAQTSGNIVAAEYFFDTDPGQGLGTAATVTTPALTINQDFLVPIANIPPGTHKLGFRVRDAEGVWSTAQFSDVTVSNCTAPPIPTAPNVSRCNTGTVKLVASGVLPNHLYKWYTVEFGGSSIFTGAEFTTPSLSSSTDYYVGTQDNVSGCESARIKVTASILNVTKPLLNASGSLTLCEGTSFLLEAPAGFSSYLWSNGATTRQILVTTTGKYSVTTNNGTCDLPLSDEVSFTFLARPTTPTIAVDGNTNICNTGSVTLNGPAGATSYLWSNGATTPSITVSSSGAYQLTVGNAAGCKSESSVGVDIAVYTTPATPTVTITGSAALCNDAFTVLSAPSGFSQYLWSNGETSQTIVVKNAGSFSVQVGNSLSCLSLSSTSVAITQTGQPCAGGTVNPNNVPPTIAHREVAIAVRGKATVDLRTLVADADGESDINFSSLRITEPPPSKAAAAIDANGILTVDYGQLSFLGSDYVVIQVCDFSGACTQQTIDVTVAGEITAYNAVSPNGDDLNEILRFEFIDLIPDTRSNQVTIYNRWGSVVFQITDYNNDDRVFKGLDNGGRELPNGTYFYRIEFTSGKKREEGFITLRK